MGIDTDTKELKSIMLKLLEEDEEFRLVVAAKLGIIEILNELKRLREDFNRYVEESNKRFEAIEKRFEVIEKRFEAIEKRLEEHDRKFNAILEEIKNIWKVLTEHNRRLSNVEDMVGVLAESTYAKFTLDMIMHECSVSGDKVVSWQRNARIDGEDIDLLVVTEKKVFIIEVKVRPRHSDVGKLIAKADIARNRFRDKQVIPILTGARIGREVMSYALDKGVHVYSW